jgi:phosphoribosyl 1,2-cyclic phosphodiesterase
MKLTFLGASLALSKGNNSNILIDFNNGKTMLFDAGITLKQSLEKTKRDISEVNDIYISHLHSDHCGSLEWIGFYSYFILKRKLNLLVHNSMLSNLWSILRPSMEMLNGQDKMMSLEDYFNVIVFDDHTFNNLICPFFEVVKQKHGSNCYGNMYSYGAIVKEENKRVFISSDTQKLVIPKLKLNNDIYNLIFLDYDVLNLSGVHPNYSDLVKLSPKIKEKVWLYHYSDIDEEMPDAVADGFTGFVKEGQIFEI